MIIKVEGIDKDDYAYFRESIENINIKFTILFKDNNAQVIYNDDYVITEQSIIEKNNAKKILLKFLEDFRLYQFNK